MDYEIELTKIHKLKLTDCNLYNVYIRDFNQYLNENTVTFDIIKEYLKESKKKYRPSTLSCIKAALKKSIKKSFSKNSRDIIFLAALDISFKSIKTGKTDKKIYTEKILTTSEIEMIINSMTERLGLIIHTLSITGLRISELLNIKLGHCKNDNDTIYIDILGKGSKERRIFIPTELFYRITSVFNSKYYLFETYNHRQFSRHYIWREIRKVGHKVLNKTISPHTLRHSFCTNMLLSKNKSLKAVSNYVGHSSTSITADMYIHDQLKPDDIFVHS